MECDHEEHECWSERPPDAPPPPPIPDFIPIELLRLGLNSTIGCDLCAWADPSFRNPPPTASIPLSSLLVIVAIVSALAGASLTATVLSIKRWQRRPGLSASVRHLTRKRNDSTSAGTSSVSTFTPASSALSENTYCEGPYSEKESSTNNIYAELHPVPASSSHASWPRPHPHPPLPPPPPPPPENSYLELSDLPSRSSCDRCTPVSSIIDESPCSSTRYADLDLGRRTLRPV